MQSNQNFYNLQSFSKLDTSGKTIGILGGSFNPPHNGHLAISLKALGMNIDYVLWLVTPQNNLKPPYEMSVTERAAACSELTKNEPRILVSNLELEIHSTNSFETIRYLTQNYPSTKFIWLMGIDCFKEFHLWENYDKIPQLINMIVFNRKGYTSLLEDSVAGKLYKEKITFVEEMLSDLSSTAIRKNEHNGN